MKPECMAILRFLRRVRYGEVKTPTGVMFAGSSMIAEAIQEEYPQFDFGKDEGCLRVPLSYLMERGYARHAGQATPIAPGIGYFQITALGEDYLDSMDSTP